MSKVDRVTESSRFRTRIGNQREITYARRGSGAHSAYGGYRRPVVGLVLARLADPSAASACGLSATIERRACLRHHLLRGSDEIRNLGVFTLTTSFHTGETGRPRAVALRRMIG